MLIPLIRAISRSPIVVSLVNRLSFCGGAGVLMGNGLVLMGCSPPLCFVVCF